MAYINDTQDPRRRATAIAGVVAVHTALALALLSMGVVGEREAPDIWDPFVLTPDPKPKPPPVPDDPPPQQQQPREQTIPPPKPTFEWPQDPPKPPVDEGRTSYDRPAVDDSPLPPLPAPRPAPSFTPKNAVPRNLPAGWISTDDYPAQPLRGEVEGVAGYRLRVGSNGQVSGCDITRSTGNRDLDQATCRLISRRARFDPATDETGASVAGSFGGTVRWEIPD